MSRVQLAGISALTFYKDELTKARRTSPIEQLTCRGNACKFYEPYAVRCENIGGRGTEVDWKCNADLPESLRFGKVEVSCEGWNAPGDPYVLQGSCGLEYRLVEIDSNLRSHSKNQVDWAGGLFMLVWWAICIGILVAFVYSCFWGNRTRGPSNTSGSSGSGRGNYPGFGYGSGSNDEPPPPYYDSPSAKPSTSQPGGSNFQPGLLSGLAMGGIGAHVLNRMRNGNEERRQTRSQQYDWERDRSSNNNNRHTWSSNTAPRQYGSGDRGEGSSRGFSGGSMRDASAFGSSSVR